jgi:hypothetical protein
MNPPFPARSRPSVFIASSTANQDVAMELQVLLAQDTNAQVWCDRTFFMGDMALDALHAAVRKHEFAVCIFGDTGGMPNANVAIELGMFLSINGAGRTFVVLLPSDPPTPVPSDLQGVTYVRIPSGLSREAIARMAHRRIQSAVETVWKCSGILAKGECWHSACSTWKNGVRRNVIEPYGTEREFPYTLEDAVIIDHQSFVTFRAQYAVRFDTFSSVGEFFGRGRKHDGWAHVHYVGTDKDTGQTFLGELLAEITTNYVTGIFITRDVINLPMVGMSIGGFSLKVIPKVATS